MGAPGHRIDLGRSRAHSQIKGGESMQCCMAELRRREVVNMADGNRLGNVEDVLVDVGSGRVAALVIPGPCRFLGLFCPGDDYIVGWDAVRRVGEDLILVDIRGDCERRRRARRPFF